MHQSGHLCPEMNPVEKFTNFTIFRFARAKITNFTCHFFALCYANKNKSATRRCGFYEICENCGFYKFNDFNDFSLLRFANFTIFFSLCYVNDITSAKRRRGFYKICENCGFCKFNDFNDFSPPRSCGMNIPRSLRNKRASHQYTSFFKPSAKTSTPHMNIPHSLIHEPKQVRYK